MSNRPSLSHPDTAIPDLVLKHPRIFEYKLTPDGKELAKGKARIQVGEDENVYRATP